MAPLLSRVEQGISALTSENDDGIACGDEQVEPGEVEKEGFFEKHARTVLFSILVFQAFIAYSVLSVLAPFFPREAENRGLSPKEYSWTFSIFPLGNCLFAPLASKYACDCNPYMVQMLGNATFAVCCFLFGSLQWFPLNHYPDYLYFVMSLLIRLMSAFCSLIAAIVTFVWINQMYPKQQSSRMAILITFVSFALTAAPAVGGWLYEHIGFYISFYLCGSAILIILPFEYFLLTRCHKYIFPETEDKLNMDCKAVEATEVTKQLTYLDIVKSGRAMLVLLALVTANVTLGSREPTLEPYLREEFHVRPTVTGIAFMTVGLSAMFMSGLVSLIADRFEDHTLFIASGQLLIAMSFLFLGHSIVFGLQNVSSLDFVFICLVILGLGQGLTVVCILPRLLAILRENGFEENKVMVSKATSAWTTSNALGLFIGPLLGGMLTEFIDFETSSQIAGLMSLFSGIILLISWLWEQRNNNSNAGEKKGLLEDDIPRITKDHSIADKIEMTTIYDHPIADHIQMTTKDNSMADHIEMTTKDTPIADDVHMTTIDHSTTDAIPITKKSSSSRP